MKMSMKLVIIVAAVLAVAVSEDEVENGGNIYTLNAESFQRDNNVVPSMNSETAKQSIQAKSSSGDCCPKEKHKKSGLDFNPCRSARRKIGCFFWNPFILCCALEDVYYRRCTCNYCTNPQKIKHPCGPWFVREGYCRREYKAVKFNAVCFTSFPWSVIYVGQVQRNTVQKCYCHTKECAYYYRP